jgi:hypothetical protein
VGVGKGIFFAGIESFCAHDVT